jgi:hypothetical protein
MEPAAAAWERAVDLGARGEYATAAEILAGLIDEGGTWSSLGLSTLASHRRQIGDIAGAMDLDARALSCAIDPESRADALIGLAADAVASGDAVDASMRHSEAAQVAAQGWRTLTRWHWVGAELSLLTADRTASTEHAVLAVSACRGRSERHMAKSRIVRAAVTGAVGDLPAVRRVLGTEGWVTLEWPLSLVAGDHAAQLPSAWLAEAWEAGRGATYTIEGCLPETLQPVWRAHPGVRRLREDLSPAGGG